MNFFKSRLLAIIVPAVAGAMFIGLFLFPTISFVFGRVHYRYSWCQVP